MKTIDIIGFDGRSWSAESLELLRNADIIAAGRRILAALPPELSARKVPLGGNLAAELETLLRLESDARLVIAASGDPLCRGIGGTLRRMLPEGSYRVHPGADGGEERNRRSVYDTLSGNRLEQRKQMERLVRGRCFLKCK